MGISLFGNKADPKRESKERQENLELFNQWLTVLPGKQQQETLREAIVELRKRQATVPDSLKGFYKDRIDMLEAGLDVMQELASLVPTNKSAKAKAEDTRHETVRVANSLLNYERQIYAKAA